MNDNNSTPLWQTMDALIPKIEALNEWMKDQPWAHEFGLKVEGVGLLSFKRSSFARSNPKLHVTTTCMFQTFSTPLHLMSNSDQVACINAMPDLIKAMKSEYEKSYPLNRKAIENIESMIGGSQ